MIWGCKKRSKRGVILTPTQCSRREEMVVNLGHDHNDKNCRRNFANEYIDLGSCFSRSDRRVSRVTSRGICRQRRLRISFLHEVQNALPVGLDQGIAQYAQKDLGCESWPVTMKAPHCHGGVREIIGRSNDNNLPP